jgi:hypothetical protein
MDKATPASMKEMICVIKYLKESKSYSLKLQPTVELTDDMKWQMCIYSDSDWTSDKQRR